MHDDGVGGKSHLSFFLGGLPASVSRAHALITFALGQYPMDNKIGSTDAAWNALPTL